MSKSRKVFQQENFEGKLSEGKDCVLIKEEIDVDNGGKKEIEIRSTDVGGLIENIILPFKGKKVKLSITVNVEEV